ncbi:MAG: MBL fold metallo-hydrolase [Gammaproteobacteria bacterium]|nr:MBL fold metallo-hydrolase [Gammaproteobacteria bacterium]
MNQNIKNINPVSALIFPVVLTTAVFVSCVLTACSPSEDKASDKTASQTSVQENAQAEIASTVDSVKQAFPYAFEKVAEDTWVIHGPRELPNPENKGFMNNPGIVITSAGLVMIDPGSTVQVGEHVLEQVRKISDLPVVAVFNTHVHGDHWLANQAVKAAYPEVKIYGHPEMLHDIEKGEGENWVNIMDTLTEGASKGTGVVAPDLAVDDSDIIKVGDTEFKIHHYGISHTTGDIMIEVVGRSVVFLGDNVTALRIPRTSDGQFQGNIATVSAMLESDIKTYVPGHGPTGDRTMVEDYLNYLVQVYAAAQKVFEENLDSSDVISITTETTADYKDWYGYDELLGPQGAQAYSEVEAAEF